MATQPNRAPLVLWTLILVAAVANLNLSVANVALPSIGEAFDSSQTALEATQAGYEVGTRTQVEVLSARRALVQAQTNYANSRFDYINSIVKLRLAAGTLDRQTLAEVNGWLSDSEPAAPQPLASGASPRSDLLSVNRP